MTPIALLNKLIGTILGAFLAAIFGIITQKYLDWSRKRGEVKKINLLIKDEMQFNFELAKDMAITKRGVYEFQADCYEKFLDKILLLKTQNVEQILETYHMIKLYNAGVFQKYELIMENIRKLNLALDWKLHLENNNEINTQISAYDTGKTNGLIIEADLANYLGKEHRSFYGVICSLNKILKAVKEFHK